MGSPLISPSFIFGGDGLCNIGDDAAGLLFVVRHDSNTKALNLMKSDGRKDTVIIIIQVHTYLMAPIPALHTFVRVIM